MKKKLNTNEKITNLAFCRVKNGERLKNKVNTNKKILTNLLFQSGKSDLKNRKKISKNKLNLKKQKGKYKMKIFIFAYFLQDEQNL